MSLCRPFFAAQGAANQPEQFRIANHFDQRAAFAARGIEVQDFRKGAIRENEPFLRVDHRDAFHHASQNGARTVALAAERADRAVHPSRRFVQRRGQIGEFVARSLGGQRTEISLASAEREILSRSTRAANDRKNRNETQAPSSRMTSEAPAIFAAARTATHPPAPAAAPCESRPAGPRRLHIARRDKPDRGRASRCAAPIAFARGECLLNFRSLRMILHGLRIVRRIGQNAAAAVNHGDARAALRHPVASTREARRRRRTAADAPAQDSGARRAYRRPSEWNRAEERARGVEINGKKDAEEQGEIRQPKFPEKPSSHGFRRDSRRRESFSCRPDAADRFRSFRAAAARTRPRCAASRIARFPTRRRAIDRA